MTAFTQDQYDAILDASEREEFKNNTDPNAVVARLRAEGHPLFKDAPAAAGAPAGGVATPGLNMPPPRGTATAAAAAERVARAEAAVLEAANEAARAPAHGPSPKPELPAPARTIATGLEGLEGLAQGDIKVPMLKIRQNVGGSSEAEHVPQGHLFISSDPGGATPTRKLRVLDVSPGRSFMMPYKKPKESAQLRDRLHHERGIAIPDESKVACSSFDRLHPNDRGWGVLASACSLCPYTKWTSAGGERIPPDCGENYRYLVLDEETGMPAVLITQKSALAPSKNLNTNLVMLGQRTKTPPAGFVVDVSTKLVGDKDKYFIPVFGRPVRGTDEDLAAALDIRRALTERRIVVDGDEHEGDA